jgi:hypothetical protein
MATGGRASHSYTNQPRVRFGAIGDGWELFKKQWGTWVVTSLIVMVANSVLCGLAVSLLPGLSDVHIDENGIRGTAAQGSTFLLTLVESLINGFLYGGMFRMACLQLRGRRIHVSDLFGITDVFGRLFVGLTLSFVFFWIGLSCCVLPGLVISSVLIFVPPLIVDGGHRGFEAVQESWRALKGQMLSATLFQCVVVILHGLGVVFCGVGLLFTMPLYPLAVSVLYRDFFVEQGKADPGKPEHRDPDF